MPFDEPTPVEIDGVRVWCTDVPGPCQGGLVIRSGKADEDLRNSGINHIVEHLALFPLMYRGLDMNGHVDELTTNFYVSGTQEQVETFLTEICRNLATLPIDRLEQERRVLETEARSSGGTFAGTASARFGARGFGVADWWEVGLRHLGADEVRAWAEERFTAAQASVWMTRPPTPALRLALRLGEPRPIPVPEPIPGLITPSHIHCEQPHLIGCSFTARRSMPLLVATVLLRDRAMATLRGDRALTYTVFRSEHRIGATDVMSMVWLDSTDELLSEALEVFTGLIHGIADGELTADDVERTHASAMPWNASDPGRPAREAARKATASLFGREPTPWKGLEAQGARLTTDRVAGAMQDALATAILVAPEGLPVPERYEPHPRPHVRHVPVDGRLFVRWDGNIRDETVVSDTGITVRSGGDETTMLFDEVQVGMLAPDGSCVLVDRAGDHVIVEPNQLMRGRILATTLIDRLGDRIVDLTSDAEGWFELQTVVEDHDTSAIKEVWREIEIVAQVRQARERILALAIGSVDSKRGLVVVTDSRLMHISTAKVPPIQQVTRDRIRSVVTTSGILGSRLVVTKTDGNVSTIDRIRPRGVAATLELVLAPIEEPSDA
jgi:hypothetical protein